MSFSVSFYTRNKVSYDAVQQIYTAKGLEHADIAMIMTNSTLTETARENARKLRVRVIENIEIPSEDNTDDEMLLVDNDEETAEDNSDGVDEQNEDDTIEYQDDNIEAFYQDSRTPNYGGAKAFCLTIVILLIIMIAPSIFKAVFTPKKNNQQINSEQLSLVNYNEYKLRGYLIKIPDEWKLKEDYIDYTVFQKDNGDELILNATTDFDPTDLTEQILFYQSEYEAEEFFMNLDYHNVKIADHEKPELFSFEGMYSSTTYCMKTKGKFKFDTKKWLYNCALLLNDKTYSHLLIFMKTLDNKDSEFDRIIRSINNY